MRFEPRCLATTSYINIVLLTKKNREDGGEQQVAKSLVGF